MLIGAAEVGSASTSSTLREPYLTLRALGRALGLSASTLWRWRPPSHDLGGRRRYLRSEVEDFLQSSEFKRRLAALRAERCARVTSGRTEESRNRDHASANPEPSPTDRGSSPLGMTTTQAKVQVRYPAAKCLARSIEQAPVDRAFSDVLDMGYHPGGQAVRALACEHRAAEVPGGRIRLGHSR